MRMRRCALVAVLTAGVLVPAVSTTAQDPQMWMVFADDPGLVTNH